MELTYQELETIIDRAVTRAIEKVQKNEPAKEYRTKADVAKAVGCSYKTVYAMMDRGEVVKLSNGNYKIK